MDIYFDLLLLLLLLLSARYPAGRAFRCNLLFVPHKKGFNIIWIFRFIIWALPCGSGFSLQSLCSCLTKRISPAIPNARYFGVFIRIIWALPCGSGFPLQSFCSCLTKRISTAIPNARTILNFY